MPWRSIAAPQCSLTILEPSEFYASASCITTYHKSSSKSVSRWGSCTFTCSYCFSGDAL